MISNCPNFILQTGDTHQMIVYVLPAEADNNLVVWSSSNPEVASVDENGLVTALSQGSVKISVTTNEGGYSKTCSIGVMSSTTGMDNDMDVNGIKIYPNPVKDKLYVEFTQEDLNREILIFNRTGQVVFKEPANVVQKIIDMNELNERGLMAVMIKSKGCSTVRKICMF